MIDRAYEIFIEGGEQQRPWADLCPDLLKSIYTKLPSHVEGTEFGSVCKNWHRVHSAAAISTPLPMPSGDHRNGNAFGVRITTDNEDDLIHLALWRVPHKWWLLNLSNASLVGRVGGWLLLSCHGRIFGFCNPLLRYPANITNMPNLEMHYCTYPNPQPIRVAFSALPTAPNWMILVVYGDRYFSTLRRQDKWFWKTYDFSLGGEREQICLGVGYRDDKFFCLFERGDMLIFSLLEEKNHTTRIMLATDAPLSPQQLDRLDSLRVVANYPDDTDAISSTVVVSWERDYEAREENSFRLVAVERETTREVIGRLLLEDHGDDGGGNKTVSSEEGGVRGVVIFVKDQIPLKTKNFEGLRHAFFMFTGSIVFLICMLFVIFVTTTPKK